MPSSRPLRLPLASNPAQTHTNKLVLSDRACLTLLMSSRCTGQSSKSLPLAAWRPRLGRGRWRAGCRGRVARRSPSRPERPLPPSPLPLPPHSGRTFFLDLIVNILRREMIRRFSTRARPARCRPTWSTCGRPPASCRGRSCSSTSSPPWTSCTRRCDACLAGQQGQRRQQFNCCCLCVIRGNGPHDRRPGTC